MLVRSILQKMILSIFAWSQQPDARLILVYRKLTIVMKR